MQETQRQIEQLLRRYESAANAGNADELRSLYTDDAVVLPGDMPTAIGADGIRDFYAYAFSMLQLDIEFDIRPEQIVLDDGLAFATTSSMGTRSIKATNETIREDNRELWIFREVAGDWRIARYMFNKSDRMRSQLSDPKALVSATMQAFFGDFDPTALKGLLTKDYIQHNPAVPTGLDPVLEILPVLEQASFSFETHRSIRDGDIVATHTTYRNAQIFGAETVVAFDLWRVEGGKVAEHWDCITPLASWTKSGRSQTDGDTEVVDLEATARNKKLVTEFVEKVLIGEDWSDLESFIADGRYDQHNPRVGDGPEALKRAVESLKIDRIHRVVGEGNFVLTQSEGTWDGERHAFYDLFRIEAGKIVEHWDVIQRVPDSMAHDNGML